jgi:hypothetical protein
MFFACAAALPRMAPVSIVILKRHGRYSSCCKHLTACATSKALPSASESKLPPPAGTAQLPTTYPKIIPLKLRQNGGRRGGVDDAFVLIQGAGGGSQSVSCRLVTSPSFPCNAHFLVGFLVGPASPSNNHTSILRVSHCHLRPTLLTSWRSSVILQVCEVMAPQNKWD